MKNLTLKSNQIVSLQSLRFFAFLLIFLSHCTFLPWYSGHWGGMGVSVFVVLSGFLVTLKHSESDKIRPFPYMLGKLKKTYPLFVVSILVPAAIMLISLVTSFTFRKFLSTGGIIFLNCTFLKSFVPIRNIYFSLNSVTWYLTLVFVFALLTPLLLKLIGKTKRNKKFGIILILCVFAFRIIWFVAWHSFSFNHWITYINPLFRLTDFFIGMYLGSFYEELKRLNARLKLSVFFISFLAMLALAAGYSLFELPWYVVLLYTPISIGLVMSFSLGDDYNGSVARHFFRNKAFVFLGNLSLELFLLHGIIIGYLCKPLYGFFSLENEYVKLLIAFSVSVFLCKIYQLAEKAIRRALKEHIKTKNKKEKRT